MFLALANIAYLYFAVIPYKNDTYFSQEYLNDFASGANEQTQGVKSRFGHPNMCSSSIGTFIGRYKNFSIEGEKVVADLHLDDATKEMKVNNGIFMFDYLMHMAEKNPDMFGNSIHIPPPKYEQDPIVIDKKKYRSHVYNGVFASDIVDSPAATSGLFDSSDDLGVIITNFLDENEQVFEALINKPELIGDFFSRYGTYYETKNKTKLPMSILKTIGDYFSGKETFDVEWTLANGDVVTVVTEAQEPQVGDEVKKADGSPLEDGDHVDKDGKTITVVGGKIDAIKDEEEDEEGGKDTPPSNTEVMQSIQNLTTQFSEFTTKANEYFKENDKALKGLFEGHKALEQKFKTLARGVGSSFEPGENKGEQGGEGNPKHRTVKRKDK